MTDPTPLYSGEAILLSWGESHRDGRVVRFKIEEDGTHPFKGLETGVNGGQRFMLVAVPVNNDNTPAGSVSGSKLSRGQNSKSKPPQLDTASKSGGADIGRESPAPPAPKSNVHIRRFMALANDRGFWNYLRRVKGKIVIDEAQAVATLKGLCNIISRDDLTDDATPSLALKAMAAEFNLWQRGLPSQ